MADYINNVAAGDQYTDACTIGPNYDAKTAVITIANNSALMQFAVGRLGNWRWTDEREFFSIPQSFKVGNVIGVKIRNANAGQVARVLATLSGDDDIEFESGLPFTGTLGANGSISSNVIIPTTPLASFPPANPTDGQLVSLILPSTFDPVGGKSIRWLCEYDASLAMWHVKGPPLYAEVLTSESAVLGAYGDLATIGPSLTLPRGGDYLIDVGSFAGSFSGSGAFMAYAIGGGAPSDNDSATHQENDGANASFSSTSRGPRPHTGLAASAVVTAKYKTGAANLPFARRWLEISAERIT